MVERACATSYQKDQQARGRPTPGGILVRLCREEYSEGNHGSYWSALQDVPAAYFVDQVLEDVRSGGQDAQPKE